MRIQLHRVIVLISLTLFTTMTAGQSSAEPMTYSLDRTMETSWIALMATGAASFDAQPTQGSGRSHDIVSIVPRVWLTQIVTAGTQDYEAGAAFIPLYGGSIAFSPDWIRGLSVLFTGFHGEGDGDAVQPSNAPGNQRADRELTRSDVELLLRYQIPDTTLLLFFGPRYITFEQRTEFSTYYIQEKTQLLIVQVGLGGFASLSESGNHRFFGNLTAGVATEFFEYESTENGFESFKDDPAVTGSIDLNVGYEYLVSDWSSVSLRYRTFVLFGEDDFGQDDLTTVHGPEIGVAFRF